MKNLNIIEQKLYFSNQRAKLAGNILTFSSYEKSYMVGNRKYRRKNCEEKSKNPELVKITTEEARIKNKRAAKRKVTDLIFCNAWQWKKRNGSAYLPIFITLTFAENITDLDFAHNEFTNFIKRLSYENWGLNVNILKYLTVVEFQKRGAIHYHVVFFNLPFMNRIYDKMRSIWGNGIVYVESVKSVRGMARYLCKYLTKSIEEGKLQARKSYFTSKNLKQPIIINFEEQINLIRAMLPRDIKGRSYSYEAEFLKHVDNIEYDLKDYPEVLETINKEIIDKYL